jgi:predicted RND superfamily exporter protein
LINDARRRCGDTVSVTYTGMLPLLAACHSTLIRDLTVSFSVSLLLIGVILIFGLRSLRLGLLSIVPNVFPIALIFGILGWLGKTIDVGSMMTASVGLGIAVDGTVHYLNWFMRGRQNGLSHNESILNAYQHAARAMVRTTAICGAGLIVYATSSFLPAARFGCIVCLLLLAALAGDLLLLPALLAGHVGQILFPDHEHDAPGGGKPGGDA